MGSDSRGDGSRESTEDGGEPREWDHNLAELEAEAFLMGSWKNFDELEEQISVHELKLILEAQYKSTRENLYNTAMLQGIDLRAEEEKARVREVKKRASEKLWKESNGMHGEDFFAELGIQVTEE